MFLVGTRLIGTVRTIGVQPNGKILVAGTYNSLNGFPTLGICRLNTDGSRDTSFDAGGVAASNVGQIVFQPDGKILVIGVGISINNGPFTNFIVRLNADGTPDNSFSLAAIPQITIGYTAATQPDGKILFSYGTSNSIPNDAGVVRLNSDGSIDSSFSTFGHQVEKIIVQPDGKILVGGPFAFGFVTPPNPTVWYVGVYRLNSDGSSDGSFRSPLTVYTPGFTEVRAMHLQSDGKIIIGANCMSARVRRCRLACSV
jgi:uncharacterized delta-60 repeat protein